MGGIKGGEGKQWPVGVRELLRWGGRGGLDEWLVFDFFVIFVNIFVILFYFIFFFNVSLLIKTSHFLRNNTFG